VAGITASSEEFGTELPDQLEEVDQLVLVAPVHVLVAALNLDEEIEIIAIATKANLFRCFIVFCVLYYLCKHKSNRCFYFLSIYT
jgi:hypothetical protein